MRSFLTILGVSIGIGAVLFLVSLGYGIQAAILSRITTSDSLLTLDVNDGGSGLVALNDESLKNMKNLPEVTETATMSALTGQIAQNGYVSNGVVNVVTPNYFRLSGIMPMYGDVADNYAYNEVIISSAGARLLNFEPKDIVGKQLKLSLFIEKPEEKAGEGSAVDEVTVVDRNINYIIRAVIEDDNNNYVYINQESVKDLELPVFNNVKIKVKAEENLATTRDAIVGMGFLVSSLSDTIAQAKKIFFVIQVVLAAFGLIALLVSAIGMFNTITISLLERTQEIGIMRAIGVRSDSIRNIFLIESIMMGFMGGLGGVAVGTVGGEITNMAINLLAKNFGGQAVNIFYRPFWFMALIVFFSSLVGFITGIYPSVRASRINPLTALKYNS